MMPDSVEIDVGLLTGGVDRPYALGLATALVSRAIRLDFIGSDDLDSQVLYGSPRLRFLNLRGSQRDDVGLATKVSRVLAYYVRLVRYVWSAKPRVLHVLWNNKFELFDRTALMLFYKLLGKKVVLTAHNVNAGKRDANDSWLNRLSLRCQYRMADHVFVHTEAMKRELLEDFQISDRSVTVIPFGLNAGAPETDLTPEQAKRQLGVANGEKTMLFFGHIEPYKGLDLLVKAFQLVAADDPTYRLVIAGKPDAGSSGYFDQVRRAIANHSSRDAIIQRIGFVPDAETEIYFKAADVLVLPYTFVSQSGVLILGYRFGTPAIAADVGSFREDVVEGQTGFLCPPGDPFALAQAIDAYFESDLFATLETRRAEIRCYASHRYSWDTVSQMTRRVYQELLAR